MKKEKVNSIHEEYLRSSLKKEAEEIEETIKDQHVKMKEEDKKILLDRIYAELREEGELPNVKTRKRKRAVWKGLATVAATVCICVGLFAHQSEARKLYLMRTVQEFFGKTVKETGNNDKDRKTSNLDIYEVMNQVHDELNIPVPEFFYLPKNFEAKEVYIDEKGGIANLKFKYNGNTIRFSLEKSESDASISLTHADEGEVIKEVTLKDSEEKIKIYKMKQKQEIYKAQWKYKNHKYELYGTIDLKEIEEILKNMWF